MSWVPLALMAAGTVTKAVSQIQEGNAMAAAEKANAEVADLQAAQVRQSGAYEETKLSRAKKQALATQRARYAKSGVLITEGSPIEVMVDTATEYEKDILANRYNTEVEARKYGYEAEYRRQMASRYKTLGYTKAVGTVLLNSSMAAIGSGFFKGSTRGVTGPSNTTSYGIKVPSTYTPAS